MKKILALALCLALALSLCACGGAETTEPTEEASASAPVSSDLADIQANGKLVIGYTVYAPMNYTDDDGNFVGFDTEFAEAVCAALGVEPEFVEIDWDNKFLELDAKGIDCIWNGMTITNEVLQNASVSDPYVKNAQVVVMDASKAADYTTPESLADLTFAAEAGSAGAEALDDLGLDYTEVAAQTNALLEVQSGAADACVIDITMADAMTGEGTSFANLTSALELTSEEYGVAFRKDSDITPKFNEIMDELMNDGTLDSLAEKYSLTLIK